MTFATKHNTSTQSWVMFKFKKLNTVRWRLLEGLGGKSNMCLQTGIHIWSQGYAIGSGIEYGSPCFLLRTQSLNICFVFLTHTALHYARTTLRILSTASANCFVMACLTSSPCNAQLNQLDLVLRFILATKISFALLTDFFSQFWHLLQLYSAQVSRKESMPKWIGFQIFDIW